MKMKDIKEITEQLEQGVKEVFTSGRYTEYLDTMSKFYHYSANNCMLIMMQKPEATMVASYNHWKNDFNRQVQKGEKAIKILAPIPHKRTKEVTLQDGTIESRESQWLSFRAVPVFDISQTDGDPLPTLTERLNGDVKQYRSLLVKIIECAPVLVHFEDIPGKALGYFSTAENRIVIRPGMGEEQTIKTLLHEVAHSILHCDGGEEKDADRETREVQAESVAYTVCKYFGINTDGYSFGYIAGWSGDKDVKQLTESIEIIRKTARTIIDSIIERGENNENN